MIKKNIDQIKRFDFRSGLANLEKNANGLFEARRFVLGI
nr:MAG TPA: GLD-3 KH domain 5 [Caudoviricetes sp.]